METTLIPSLSRALSLRNADCSRPQPSQVHLNARLPATPAAAQSTAESNRQSPGMMKVRVELISTDDWLAEINRLVSVSKINYLNVARIVFAAKRDLSRGQWTAMWESEGAPFKKGKADALFSIGKNLGELNAQTSEHLPAGWNPLYQLSRLDRDTLMKLIDEGTIHPRITFNAARELVARFKGGLKKKATANVIRRLHRFRAFIDKTLNEWTRDERELAQLELSEVIEQIAGVGPQKIDASIALTSAEDETPVTALRLHETYLKNTAGKTSNALQLL